jgi:AbrB family looped-hinge helix DNA binding protein
MATITKLKLDNQGRLLIPSDIRASLGLSKGDDVVFWIEDSKLVIEGRDAFVKHLRQKYRSDSGHEVDDLLRARRDEVTLES